jgi:uncharacterized membrane protein YbhN (UPF0104 family)
MTIQVHDRDSSSAEAAPGSAAPPAPVTAVGSARRRWMGLLARMLLALAPLAWISTRVHWREVSARAAGVGPLPVLESFALMLGCVALGAARWRALLRAYDVADPPGLLTLVRHSLIGQYYNLMPGGVAGDAVRGYRVRAYVDLATSYTILLVDRLAGLCGLLVLALGAAMLGPRPPAGLASRALLVAAGLGLALALFSLGVPQILARSPAWRARVARIPRIGPQLSLVQPVKRPGGLLAALLFSLGTQGAAILAMVAPVMALSPGASLIGCFRAAPVVLLLLFVPLTPGGVGQREALFIELYGTAHVVAAAAVAASLLTFAAGIAVALLGVVCLFWERMARGRRASLR